MSLKLSTFLCYEEIVHKGEQRNKRLDDVCFTLTCEAAIEQIHV